MQGIWQREISKLLLIVIHFFCSILLVYRFTEYLAEIIFINYKLNIHYNYVDWVKFWYNYNSPFDLLYYILFSAFLFSFLLLFQWFRHTILFQNILKQRLSVLLTLKYAFCSLLWNLILFRYFKENPTSISLIWIASNVIIFGFFNQKINCKIQKYSIMFKKIFPLIAVVLMLFSFFLLCKIFVPLINGEYYLYNEYIEVPEKTITSYGVLDNQNIYKNDLYYPKFLSVDEFLNSNFDSLKLDNDLQTWLKEKKDDTMLKEFISKNKFSFKWQIFNRSFDLHQHQVLNPVNSWMNGEKLNNIEMLYGLGNSWLAKKWFEFRGGLNYENWFMFIYPFYLIYIFLSFIVIYLILKDFIWSYIGMLIAMISLVYNIYEGYFYIIIGQMPINPIRHIFDVIIPPILFYYFKNYQLLANGKKILINIILLIICGLAQLNGDHYGIALSLSCSGLFLFYSISNKRISQLFPAILFPILIVIIMINSPLSHHDGIKYFLDGYFSFHNLFLPRIFFCILLFYSTIAYSAYKDSKNPYMLTSLFLGIYLNIILIHFVWNTCVIYYQFFIFPAFMAILLLIVSLIKNSKKLNIIKYTILVLTIVFFSTSYNHFQQSKQVYMNIFKDHITYKWNFPRAHFYTTMPPEPFTDIEALLNKYAPEQKVYYLSKYDFMLPVLFGKSNAFKFGQIAWFVVTDTERNSVINTIQNEKPEYLFVDTNIDIESQLWTVNNYFILNSEELFNENKRRIQMLKEVDIIYRKIISDYTPIESSELITVYKRCSK